MTYQQLLTNMTNLSSFSDLLQQANTNTGNSFWSVMLWSFIIVLMITTFAFGIEIAIMFSLFGGLIMGIFLLYLGLINQINVTMIIAILIVLIIYFVSTSNRNN